MKAPFKTVFYSAMALSLAISPAFAEEAVTSKVITKHEADKEHKYEELFIENGGDLDPAHWASASIEQLINKYCGIMVGYEDNTFRGSKYMTRNEMAAALYKLMQCLDVQIVEVPEPQTLPDNLLLKEDLLQVALLQKALKPELDDLMAKHLELDKRIEAEEAIQVHGGIKFLYRDRVAVTDGTDTTSPLFAKNNSNPTKQVNEGGVVVDRDLANDPNKLAFSNNINQFVRDSFGLPDEYHSPGEPNITIDDLAAFRSRTWLEVNAKVQDWISVSTAIDLFEIGRASSGLSGIILINNGGHDINEGMPDGSNFMFRKAEIKLQAPDSGFQVRTGLMNFSEMLNPNTSFNSLFDAGAWNGRDYGFVGWGGADVALTNTAITPYRNSLSRYWSGGLSSSMVDPDSKRYNQATSPAVALRSSWGSGSFFAGMNMGSVQTQRLDAANGNLSSGGPAVQPGQFTSVALWSGAVLQGKDRLGNLTGNHLALPSQYGDGYAVLGLEQSLFQQHFPVRLSLAAMHYYQDELMNFNAASRKEVSGTLDLGWNKNFGITMQVNKSFIGYDRHSLGLLFNNIADSGVDIQLAANAATRGLFNVADMATGTAGVALGIPVMRAKEAGKDDIKLIFGLRQSFADNFGTATQDGALNQVYKDSGLTVSLPYNNIMGTNLSMQLQYGLLWADAFWMNRQVAQDIALITTYSF